MPSAAQIGEDIRADRSKFQSWYDAFPKDADGRPDMKGEDIKKFRDWNAALEKKNGELKEAQDVESGMAQNEAELKRLGTAQPRLTDDGQPGDGAQRPALKTLGELFVESEQFLASQHLAKGAVGPAITIDIGKEYGKAAWAQGPAGLKTLFDTASSWSIQNVRLPTPLTPQEQQLRVADLMPQGRTSGNAVAYMEETTTTNAGAETAESGSKPESALAFTEKTSAVRKVATSLPVTDESLEDIPFIESYLDSRLSLFVQQREDSQLLVGNGTPPNLRGIINTSGILTQARGSDANQDAIFKAGIKVQSQGFLDPTAVVLHPNNWQTIRLMTTADGIYLFGPPSQTGPNTIWGWDVVSTTAITANTGLVGAFRTAAEIFRRSDLALQVGWINDQFVKNQRTIVVEERLALVVFRPKGFATVTSLN